MRAAFREGATVANIHTHLDRISRGERDPVYLARIYDHVVHFEERSGVNATLPRMGSAGEGLPLGRCTAAQRLVRTALESYPLFDEMSTIWSRARWFSPGHWPTLLMAAVPEA